MSPAIQKSQIFKLPKSRILFNIGPIDSTPNVRFFITSMCFFLLCGSRDVIP